MYAVVAVLSHLTHSPLVADKVQPQLLQVVYFRAKATQLIYSSAPQKFSRALGHNANFVWNQNDAAVKFDRR